MCVVVFCQRPVLVCERSTSKEVSFRRAAKGLCAFCVYVTFLWSISCNLTFFWLSLEMARLCMTSYELCLECVVMSMNSGYHKRESGPDAHGMHTCLYNNRSGIPGAVKSVVRCTSHKTSHLVNHVSCNNCWSQHI